MRTFLVLALLITACRPSGKIERLPDDLDGSLTRVTQAGVLKVGADPTSGLPFWTKGEKGQYDGFEKDVADYLAQSLKVKLQVVPTRWDQLDEELAKGRYDVAINALEIPKKPAGVPLVWSEPYLETAQDLLVPPEDNTTQTIRDLHDMQVGVLADSTARLLVEETMAKSKLKINLETFATLELLFQAMEQRKVQAAILDRPLAGRFLMGHADFKRIKGYFPTAYGVALRKEDRSLREALNQSLKLAPEDEQYQGLLKKWKLHTPTQPS